ncbi:MAG: M4 family metallopeptidase, partial [Bacteroidota bacterium]
AVYIDEGLVVLPRTLNEDKRDELCRRFTVGGISDSSEEDIFLGATTAGIRLRLSLVLTQNCTHRHQLVTTEVPTLFHGRRRIPLNHHCLEHPTLMDKGEAMLAFGLRTTPKFVQYYSLDNSDLDEAYAGFRNIQFRAPFDKSEFIDNEIICETAQFTCNDYHEKGYFDGYWALKETLDYYAESFGRRDYRTLTGDRLTVKFGMSSSFYSPASNTLNLAAETDINRPQTHLHVVAHEYSHIITEKTARFIYLGEPGALHEAFADIFAMIIHDYVGLPDHKWAFGEEYSPHGFRNFEEPALNGHPQFYRGENWYDTNNFKVDNGGVHKNSSVMNHWFYLLSEGVIGAENERGQRFMIDQVDQQKVAKVLYRALHLYLGRMSNFKQAREATIQAAEDLYGECSNEAKAIGNAWNAVGVGDPYTLCDDVWVEFISYPDPGATTRIYLDGEREVTVVENDYKITKVINYPLEGRSSRWVVSNKTDGGVERANFPFPYIVAQPRPEAETFAQLGLAIGKTSAGDLNAPPYTPEDFDQDFLVPNDWYSDYLTENGIMVRKYEHPTMEDTYFWSTPQIEVPFLAHSWAMRFGSLDPNLNITDNIFRGFLLKMKGPTSNHLTNSK